MDARLDGIDTLDFVMAWIAMVFYVEGLWEMGLVTIHSARSTIALSAPARLRLHYLNYCQVIRQPMYTPPSSSR